MTDGQLSDDGPATPQQAGGGGVITPGPGAEPHDADMAATDYRQFGGGGMGWRQPTDAGRLAVVARPGGIGAGLALPVDPAAAAGANKPHALHSTGGPRAVGVAAAILVLLLAASSTVWALYKCKPGLVRDRPEVDVPLYAVDQFLDTYRPPTPQQKPTTPGSPGVLSNGTPLPLTGVFHVAPVTMSSGAVNSASQTALNAGNWDNYINELSSLFSTQLTATGSGVAGLIAGAASVTRGTQTELIGAGLGRQLPGNYLCDVTFSPVFICLSVNWITQKTTDQIFMKC